MRIALVADIPDQPVFGSVEHIMDGSGQLDHAQASPQMPAGYRNSADRFRAQFVCQLAELGRFQLAKVCRNLDLVEQGRDGCVSHASQL